MRGEPRDVHDIAQRSGRIQPVKGLGGATQGFILLRGRRGERLAAGCVWSQKGYPSLARTPLNLLSVHMHELEER